MYTSDKEAIILEYIYNNDSLKQRELADKANISLGMVNAILKRLMEKGWLVTKRVNSRNISYMVSPAGMEEVFKRGYQYFKRTIDDVIIYKAEIEKLVKEASASGFKGIVLVGKSDLDFIVEYVCNNAGIEFEESDKNNKKSFLTLFSEQYEADNKIDKKYWLRSIIMRKK